MRKSVTAAIGGAALLGLTALPAQAATGHVKEAVKVPASMTIDADIIECTNKSSTVSVGVNGGVGGLKLKTIFKNNTKGTKTQTLGESTVDATTSENVSLAKQPVQGGVGGNPYISVAMATKDSAGEFVLLSTPTIIGRCVQGTRLKSVTQQFSLPVAAAASATGLQCDSKGSVVELGTSAESANLFAVLVFDNNKNEVVHRSIQETDGVVQIRADSTHKGWGQVKGAGGNPLVYLRFENSIEQYTEFFVGRCKDLM